MYVYLFVCLHGCTYVRMSVHTFVCSMYMARPAKHVCAVCVFGANGENKLVYGLFSTFWSFPIFFIELYPHAICVV